MYVVNFGPDRWHAFADAAHQHAHVDVGFEHFAVRAGKVDRCDDAEHDEGFLFVFVEEEQEESGEEVEGLAVADVWVVDGESLEDTAEGAQDRGFGVDERVVAVGAVCAGYGVRFEANIIRESSIEIALDDFSVRFT